MRTEIYVLNIESRLENPVDEYLKFFSASRVQKILRYKFNAGRNRTIFAEILARKLIAEKTGKNFNEIEIFRDENGKPFCNEPGIFFSLSHSGKYIACSIGENSNGIDIELLNRKIDLKVAERFFLKSEYEILKSLDESERAKKFFEFWTLKEAALKCFNLREWTNVDCEKLLNENTVNYFGMQHNAAGKNFYFANEAIIGLCVEDNKNNNLTEKINFLKNNSELLF